MKESSCLCELTIEGGSLKKGDLSWDLKLCFSNYAEGLDISLWFNFQPTETNMWCYCVWLVRNSTPGTTGDLSLTSPHRLAHMKVQNSYILEPLAFKEIWQMRTAWILRIVYKLIGSCLLESLAQVGSKYLEVNFCSLGFTILKRLFMKMLKRIRNNFSHLVLLHIFWCHMSILN